jgi:alkaline phosphatase
MNKKICLAAFALVLAVASDAALAGGHARNIIFFLGDGMGPTVVTAARIYAHGEDGRLSMESLEHTARIITYSNDAQTTDSAPSMAAYMTGVKMNNEVISMSPDTTAVPTGDNNTTNNCGTDNGHPVATLLELAKVAGLAVGAVTTTRVTHATPAATYAHICHRDLENDIARQMVPGGAGTNPALGADGLDVLMGGGRKHYLPDTESDGFRTDGRDLIAELRAQGYTVATDRAGFDAIDGGTPKVVGLFTASHMSYELDRDPAEEPSLAEMTSKAIDILSRNRQGYVLMIEGGRIDHALHDTNAARALEDVVAFDDAIHMALAKVNLRDTLVVVTADHDHTMTINGYGKRTGATSPGNAGILGLVRNVTTGNTEQDAEGMPYTNLVFGNGDSRVAGARSDATALDETTTGARDYHQEAAVKKAAGAETHGGGDVMLMATGAGSDTLGFKGVMVNTRVFALLHDALGL